MVGLVEELTVGVCLCAIVEQASLPSVFEFIGCDLFRTEGKVDLISQLVEMPEEFADDKVFIINAQVPIRDATRAMLEANVGLTGVIVSLTAAIVRSERLGRRERERTRLQPCVVLEDPEVCAGGVLLIQVASGILRCRSDSTGM